MTDQTPRRPSAVTPDKIDMTRAMLLQRPTDARVMIREMPIEQILAQLPQGQHDYPNKEDNP